MFSMAAPGGRMVRIPEVIPQVFVTTSVRAVSECQETNEFRVPFLYSADRKMRRTDYTLFFYM